VTLMEGSTLADSRREIPGRSPASECETSTDHYLTGLSANFGAEQGYPDSLAALVAGHGQAYGGAFLASVNADAWLGEPLTDIGSADVHTRGELTKQAGETYDSGWQA
jgi:hypothetical protein